MKKRRRARELVLQGLYSSEIAGNSCSEIEKEISERCQSDEEIMAFASDLLGKAMEHRESLDQEVASVVENWEFKRIALIDRLILRMALCELLYFDEIPPKVTINEAIDLAKAYSTSQSGRFVNGILDSLFQKCKGKNRIVKKGRGLID